ncbi:STAS domain-containing protein [bacterium]|nr:STAS domain-containing protein [bacterium]
MELVVEGNKDTLQVRIMGELVADTCSDLRDMVLESAAKEPNKVVLHMAETPFIDTSGVGVLVGLRAHLRSKGIGIEIAQPSPRVHQVLSMMRLLPIFGLTDDV